ncbi:MAG: ankyrin repeat domain-containing protein, partial [Gammaproteobacteria bacterium]|nr:ankyrin repeat domain-containing protein [Gammaproteobacteria bacterium]
MSESRLLREQPMDLGIIKEIDPESFTEIIVDEESKELYNLGEIGQRYAYIRSYKVGYGLTLKKLKKNPELDDLKPNSIGILSEDNQLTVYWIEKGKVVNRSFTEDSVPEIANALHEFAETSNNPSLIKAIISKYECTLQGKWHIRLRPGYPFTIDAKTAEDAQKRFSNRYVIAEQTNIGIVHRKVEKQVTEKEPLLFRPDEMNPRIFQEAGSFWKLKDGKILWINRSTANTNINKKNELALSCFAFSPKKFDFSRPAYTNEFHLRRSSAEDFFCPMANTVTVQLGGNEAIFYSATADCYSFNIAKEWQIICEMKEGPEKILLIQEKLMRTIYISAGIDPDKDNDGLLPLIKNALKVANEEKISLNLDEIPQGFDKKNGTALEMAIKKGYIDVALLLIDNGASINLSCILAAIKKGNNLLLKKIEPHINNMFKSMNLEMLLALIEKGNISFLRRVENIEHLLQSMTPDMALSLSPFSLIKQGEYDLLEQLVAKGLILNKTQL